MRVAAYYAPHHSDPLWSAGCTWLGRDPETAATLSQPDLPNIAELTEAPRLYGFHATLKPPMRLATPYAAVLDDAARIAATLAPFDLPQLAVVDHKGFLALRETVHSPALHAMADSCVTGLDRHRAPADEAELARRRKHGLPPEQEAMLQRWGYPHVLGTWFFHMTLTRRLTPPERDALMPEAQARFADALARPRRVDALTLYTQAESGAPFLVAERLPLRG